MTKFCLGTSTSLLHDLMEKTLTLYAKRQSPVPDLLHLALGAGSNIVKAVALAAASQSDLWFFREKLSQGIQLVERFLQVCITSPSICCWKPVQTISHLHHFCMAGWVKKIS